MSEEQVREYLAQLRSAPADQVISEVVSVLLNAASAKLGRRDARLLIDLSAAMLERSREYISGDVAQQVDNVLGQLRLGQVQAEAQVGDDETNDLSTMPPAPEQPAQGEQPPPQGQATPKLWIPGRD
ncbi:MAG TPA: hypothetical protein VFZ37_03505 [Jiangellaceae bacterium]